MVSSEVKTTFSRVVADRAAEGVDRRLDEPVRVSASVYRETPTEALLVGVGDLECGVADVLEGLEVVVGDPLLLQPVLAREPTGAQGGERNPPPLAVDLQGVLGGPAGRTVLLHEFVDH